MHIHALDHTRTTQNRSSARFISLDRNPVAKGMVLAKRSTQMQPQGRDTGDDFLTGLDQ